jgi:hypothetical protein
MMIPADRRQADANARPLWPFEVGTVVRAIGEALRSLVVPRRCRASVGNRRFTVPVTHGRPESEAVREFLEFEHGAGV